LCDENPDSNVKFALVYQNWIFNILLNNERCRADVVGLCLLLFLFSSFFLTVFVTLAKFYFRLPRVYIVPLPNHTVLLLVHFSVETEQFEAFVDLLGHGQIVKVFAHYFFKVFNSMENMDTNTPVECSSFENPYVLATVVTCWKAELRRLTRHSHVQTS